MTVADDFEREGYAVFRRGLDVDEVGCLEREIVETYSGPLYRHDLRMARHSEIDLNAVLDLSGLMDAHLWKLPGLRQFTLALRRVLFSEAIYDALHAIDGEPRYTLHQSIFFFRSPRLGPHMDRRTLDTTPLARSFTVWIAIDTVSPANGAPYVVPTGRGQYWVDPGTASPGENKLIHDWATGSMPPIIMLAMNAGDFAVWAPSTPHGSLVGWPITASRRAIQAIYRPTSILKWGNDPDRLADLHDAGFEEEEVNSRFNCLISKRGGTNEQFRRAGFEMPTP